MSKNKTRNTLRIASATLLLSSSYALVLSVAAQADSGASPTVFPSPSAIISAPTELPVAPSSSAEPEEPTPTPLPTDDPAPIAEPTSTPSATSEPTPTLIPIPAPTVTPEPTPTVVPTPEATREPTPTLTPSPEPTPSPTPGAPGHTPTPRPSEPTPEPTQEPQPTPNPSSEVVVPVPSNSPSSPASPPPDKGTIPAPRVTEPAQPPISSPQRPNPQNPGDDLDPLTKTSHGVPSLSALPQKSTSNRSTEQQNNPSSSTMEKVSGVLLDQGGQRVAYPVASSDSMSTAAQWVESFFNRDGKRATKNTSDEFAGVSGVSEQSQSSSTALTNEALTRGKAIVEGFGPAILFSVVGLGTILYVTREFSRSARKGK